MMAQSNPQMQAQTFPAWPPAYPGAYQQPSVPPPIPPTPVPQAAYAAISPPPLRRINQLRFINRHKHMYHPLEVAEAEPTEAEDVEEVEENNVGNHVGINIAIVQHMEQHLQRPEEPRWRYKQRPPDQKTT